MYLKELLYAYEYIVAVWASSHTPAKYYFTHTVTLHDGLFTPYILLCFAMPEILSLLTKMSSKIELSKYVKPS